MRFATTHTHVSRKEREGTRGLGVRKGRALWPVRCSGDRTCRSECCVQGLHDAS